MENRLGRKKGDLRIKNLLKRSHSSKARKGDKRHTDGKIKNKTVSIHRHIRKLTESTTKLLE